MVNVQDLFHRHAPLHRFADLTEEWRREPGTRSSRMSCRWAQCSVAERTGLPWCNHVAVDPLNMKVTEGCSTGIAAHTQGGTS